MRIYCVSDLHLHHDHQPFLFTADKERAFCAVASEALETGATLLLAGDVFDLTGMTAPVAGLTDFFRKVAPDASLPTPPLGLVAQLRALHERFPKFFLALTHLAKDKRLWFIPGNHDCAIATPEGKEALGRTLGASPSELTLERTFRVGAFLFATHGNDYDRSNKTTCGCNNRGAVITSVLYHAVIPALSSLGVPSQVAHAIPAVRPEENLVEGLELYLSVDRTKDFLLGMVELLLANGYFAGLALARAWLATHLLPSFVSPARVRSALANDTNLKESTRRHAEAILDAREPAVMDGPTPQVVVMGHTHELDATHSYVNLGTWIDHVRGVKHEDLVNSNRSLPVLVVDGESGSLHDCLGMTGPVTNCPQLWRRSGSEATRPMMSGKASAGLPTDRGP